MKMKGISLGALLVSALITTGCTREKSAIQVAQNNYDDRTKAVLDKLGANPNNGGPDTSNSPYYVDGTGYLEYTVSGDYLSSYSGYALEGGCMDYDDIGPSYWLHDAPYRLSIWIHTEEYSGVKKYITEVSTNYDRTVSAAWDIKALFNDDSDPLRFATFNGDSARPLTCELDVTQDNNGPQVGTFLCIDLRSDIPDSGIDNKVSISGRFDCRDKTVKRVDISNMPVPVANNSGSNGNGGETTLTDAEAEKIIASISSSSPSSSQIVSKSDGSVTYQLSSALSGSYSGASIPGLCSAEVSTSDNDSQFVVIAGNGKLAFMVKKSTYNGPGVYQLDMRPVNNNEEPIVDVFPAYHNLGFQNLPPEGQPDPDYYIPNLLGGLTLPTIPYSEPTLCTMNATAGAARPKQATFSCTNLIDFQTKSKYLSLTGSFNCQ